VHGSLSTHQKGMTVAKQAAHRRIPAIKVHQWLRGWERVEFSSKSNRRKPLPHFYLFALPAVELRRLCGIARRQISDMTPRAADLGIQREHDPERSGEILRFVEFGYPWSTLSESKRKSAEFDDLEQISLGMNRRDSQALVNERVCPP